MEKNNRDLLRLAIAGTIVIFLISLVLKDLAASIRLTLTYVLFVYMPFLMFISSIKNLDLIERFVLANISGLAYSSLYIFLDVALKIPLMKVTFVIVTSLIYLASYKLSRSKP